MSYVLFGSSRPSMALLAALLLSAGTWSSGRAEERGAADTAGWQTVPGGAGTGCATDATPYEFYVREADRRRIAVFFQGGGACWNARTCGLAGRRTFEPAVDRADYPWRKAHGAGVFELDNPRNPLREFTIILAPYCTADVHLGVRSGRFESGNDKLDVHYRGLANAQRVMDWVRQRYADPSTLFITGASAGAVPSPVFAAQLARHYPRARVVQLGDGAGGYRTARIAGLLEEWGAARALKHDPLFHDLDVTTANFETFYLRTAAVPNLQLAQLNSVEDRVQIFFLGEIGHPVAALGPLLSGNLAELRKADPKLRTYTAPGMVHVLLQRLEFYTTKVDDVELTRWVDDLIHGRRVANVGDALLPAPAERLQ